MANDPFAPPLTPLIDPTTGTVTEIGRIYFRILGGAVGLLSPVNAAYWVDHSDVILSNERNLGALTSGYLKIAVALGIATPSTVAAIPIGDVSGLAAALALLAPLLNPALTGVPTAPTAGVGTNTTQLATTAFVLANGGSSGNLYTFTDPRIPTFTWINQGGATETITGAKVYLEAPIDGTFSMRIRMKAAPATPYTLTIGFLAHLLSVNSASVGPIWRESSSGKIVACALSANAAASGTNLSPFKATSPTVFSASYVTGPPLNAVPNGVFFLRIADDGVNRTCWYSRDGDNFILFHTVGRTDFLTADEIGFFANEQTGAYPAGIALASWKEA